MLIKRPDVEFCGYSIPHPSENFMNLRLQVVGKLDFFEGNNVNY